MTKSELIEEVARQAPSIPKRDVEMIVNTIFDNMTAALVRHDRIEIRGFGSFIAKPRRAREGRNPRTGEPVHVPQKWVPFFTVGKELRRRINEGDGANGSASSDHCSGEHASSPAGGDVPVVQSRATARRGLVDSAASPAHALALSSEG